MSKKAVLNTKIFNVDELNKAGYNPRKDLQKDDLEYKKLKKSIEEFSYVDPLIFNEKTKTLISGHQRLKVLKDLGYTEIEVNCVSLDIQKEKALNIALNKITGEWENDKLTELLNELTQDLDFNVNITGFSDEEIKELCIKSFDFTPVLDSIQSGAFSESINALSGVFNITFSFPVEKKEFILNKIKENTKEYYTSRLLEVFNA